MRHKTFWMLGLLGGGLALGARLVPAEEPAHSIVVGPSDTSLAPGRLVQQFKLSVARPDGSLIGDAPSRPGGTTSVLLNHGLIIDKEKGTITATTAAGLAEEPAGRGAEPAGRPVGPAGVVLSQGTISEFMGKDEGVVTLTPAGASADPPALSITVIVEARPSPPRGAGDCPTSMRKGVFSNGPSEYVYPMQVHWRPGATAADPGTIHLTTHDPRPVGPSGCPSAFNSNRCPPPPVTPPLCR